MKNADIRQLELMCELVETQSLSEAAARLGITPSAASQSLSRLRAALGEEVCVRQGSAYRLTPHGELVIGALRSIVARWREAQQVARQFDPSRCALRFAVACVADSALPDLVRLHTEFHALAPQARLDSQVPLQNAADWQALRSGMLDVLCARAPPSLSSRDLHHELLCVQALTHVLLSKTHRRIGDTLTMDQYLAEEHLVAYYNNLDPTSRSPLDQALMARGFPARRSTYVQSLWTCLHMLSLSDALMTLSTESARLLALHLSRVRTLPLPPDMPTVQSPLYMIWHERTHHSRPHQWLRERLRAATQPVPHPVPEDA
jgi:DNA-binding transcriptional LysR family regulator